MPRYRNRRLQLGDLVPRFESKPSAVHCRNAVAAIQRLRDDRREFCLSGSAQDARWLESCDALIDLINGMSRRREIEDQSLATAMREFVQEFEHSTKRIDQILHAERAPSDDALDHEAVRDWIDLLFRLATYAILSEWIDDKTESRSVQVSLDLASGDKREAWTHEPMEIPSRYQRAAKKL